MQLFAGIRFLEPACLLAVLLALSPNLAPAQACGETASTVTPLGGATGCSTCDNSLLPGSQAPSPLSAYTVHSDMPERFCSTGVLYSTEPILAPDSSGTPSLAMRTQVNDGSFTALDQTFDTFFFHTVSGCSGGGVRRIVLYAKNIGSSSVTLTPRQNIITDGAIGTVHEMETNLGTRVLSDTWDTPVAAQAIPAGGGAIIAYSKQFNASSNGSDTSANTNCFGFVRTAVSGTSPSVRLYVVAIDGAAISENKTRAEALLNVAATSGETISLDTQPSDATCENRRATGVFDSFVWRNNATTIDADALPASGISYQMALSSLSSSACSAAKQTGDMALRPPFVRGDSVGNFMVEYRVTFRLINKDPNLRRGFDVTFGKSGADMGLAWKVATGTTTPSDATVDAATTRSAWAGPNQSALTKSFLASDGGPIVLNPCEAREVAIRFVILGNSSLPFQVNVVPYDPPEYIIDNGAAQCTTVGSWTTSANAGFYGTNSLVKAGGTGSATVTWTPNLNQSGSYDVYAWWVAAANRATNAPYTINHLDGSTAVAKNQTTGGSAWNLLGTFNLNAGTGNSVVLSDNVAAASYVSADAVRFVYKGAIERVVDNTDAGCVTSGTWSGSSNAGFYGTNSLVRAAGTGSANVTWSPNLPYSGLYKVYGWWVASSNRVDAAAYTINGVSGATASAANQKSNGSKWNLLGEVQFNSGTAGNLVLTDAGTAGLYVSADAARFVLVQAGSGSGPTPTPTPSPTPSPTATPTPTPTPTPSPTPTPTPSPSPSPTPSTTTVVLAVVAAEDGYILETNETAQAGGSLSSAGVDIRLGDDNQDRAMRGVLSFDTSTIPAGATITRATLKLTRASLTGTTPWNTLGTLVADIAVPKLGSTTALEVGDWQAAVTASAVATVPQPSGDGVQVTTNLSATGISNINRTGRTQFKLRFTTEDDDNRTNNYITMASGNHGTTSYRPVLEIEYQN